MTGIEAHEASRGGGRYTLRRVLGSGAMGRVYVAFDAELERDVALKVLHHSSADDLFHLKQEFRTLADLRHPNLVALYDLFVDADGPFFTMEILPGPDLVTYVRGAGAAATLGPPAVGGWERLRGALPSLLDGLDALHATGRLHRDLKPTNLIVTPDRGVVLIDFGLATVPALVPGPHDATLAGTLAYMAPELLRGAPHSAASDYYALGASLMQALTGAPPATTAMAPRAPAAAARAAVAETPADLDALTTALLHHDAARRADRAGVRRHLRLVDPTGVPRFAPSAAALWEAPFVDREESLAALGAALADVASGSPITVRVEGPSGIGKSALLRHFLGRVQDRSTLILTGRCYPHESVPFKALDGIVDGLSEALTQAQPAAVAALPADAVAAVVRLFPVLGRVPALAAAAAAGMPPSEPEQARRVAFRTLRDLLGGLAATRRLIVWIDDLQWGDADSAVFLRVLAHPREAPPILVLLSYRAAEWEASAVAAALRDEGRPLGRIITLTTLPDGEARALAAALLAGTANATAAASEAVARESGGNPFLLCEIARYCAAGATAASPGVATPLPASIAEIVAWRLRTLDPHAHRLLATVAVAGGPCRRTVAGRAAALPGATSELVTALRNECLLRHSLGGADLVLETFHDRIREAVVDTLPTDERRSLHLALAAALEAEPDTDPIVLVGHYRDGGDDRRAARSAVVAAERAYDALAFEQAARLYEFALQVDGAETPRWRLLRGRADALSGAGRGAEAGASYRDAAQSLGRDEPGAPLIDELTRLAAEQLLRSGRIDEGTAELRAALRAVGERYPATPWRAGLDLLRHRGGLMLRGLGYRPCSESSVAPATLRRLDALWSAAVGLVWADSIRSAAFHGRHTRLALDVGEPHRVVRALCTESVFHSAISGRWAAQRAARALAAAEALSSELGDPFAIGLTAVCASGSAYFAGHFRTASNESDRAEAILRARCTGVAWELTNAHIFGSWSLAHLGDLPRLRERMPELLERARERDDLLAFCCLRAGLPTAMYLLADGQLEAARAAVREALGMWPTRDFQLANYFGLVSATLADLYAGDATRAWQRVRDATATLRAVRLLDFRLVRVEFQQLAARCAIVALARDRSLDAAERRAMGRLVTRAGGAIGREGMPWAAPLAAALAASGAAARGDRNATDAALAVAAAGFTAADMTLWAAAARHQAGAPTGTAAMQACGVVDPDRYAEMLIPVRSLSPATTPPAAA